MPEKLTMVTRGLLVIALVCTHITFSWLLSAEAGLFAGNPAGEPDLFPGDARLSEGKVVDFNSGERVWIDATSNVIPFFTPEPLTALRYLDPTFFMRSLVVKFQARSPIEAEAEACSAEDGQTCSKRVAVCDPANITIAVSHESGINQLAHLFPGDGAEKVLSLCAEVLPSLTECSFDQPVSGACSLRPSSEVQWADSRWLVCDELCNCELGVPTVTQFGFVVLSNVVGGSELEVSVSSVELSQFPPVALIVFIVALVVLQFYNELSENKYFKVAVAFSLGIVIFGFFLLVFIYNIAQKGISQIPGLGFLRHINRSGTVGILGFGGLFTISRLVNIDHTDIIGTLRYDESDVTLYLPLNGWTDTYIPVKYIILFTLGISGIGFKWYYGWFEKKTVEDGERSSVNGGFSSESSFIVQMKEVDSFSLILLKNALWWTSLLVALRCWSDLSAFLCLLASGHVAMWLYARAEHARHIPSYAERSGWHGGFKDKGFMKISGRGIRGDSTPAKELTESPAPKNAKWAYSEEALQFSEEQLEDMREIYTQRPELISRLNPRSQDAVRNWLDGGSHLGEPLAEPATTGRCGRCCKSFRKKVVTAVVWVVALSVLFGIVSLIA